ncbi:MAG: RNA-binding S4 domain-containing protein [Rikenellaceae bacterium]
MESVRIDKWLWSVRIFKTRSDAAEACRANRVTINGAYTKPSRDIKCGDTFTVTKLPVTYTYKVKELVSSRQGAKLVENYLENLTPASELEKLNTPKESVFIYRDKGTGRPTKKDRREMEELLNDLSYINVED